MADQVAAMVDDNRLPNPIPVSGAQLVQVVDAQDRVIAGSLTADRLTPLLRPAELGAAEGRSALVVAGDRAGLDGPLRVVTLAAGPAANRQHVIVGVRVRDVERSASELRTVLLFGFPLLLAVLAAIAWRVIGWTLGPVESLREAAERIGGTGRDEKLPVPTANDEIHALATTLNTMLDRLAAARRRQRDFVADAAHELRSPLASIRTQLEVAEHLGDGGTLPHDVLADVDRLSAVIEDLLLLAKADAHARAPAVPTAFEVRALLTEIAAAKTISPAQVSVATGPAVHILADRAEIRRAVTNLVDNAARYARESVELAVAREPGLVRISVTDDGPGIDESDREKVFDRFTRLDDARDRETGGTGLGLAIVRELIRRAGGAVAFRDPDGPTGITAEIRLPDC